MVASIIRVLMFASIFLFSVSCSQPEMTFEKMRSDHAYELGYCQAGKPDFKFSYDQLSELVKRNIQSSDQSKMSDCVRSLKKNRTFQNFKENLDIAVDRERLEKEYHDRLSLILAKGAAYSNLATDQIGEAEANSILEALGVVYCRYHPDLRKENIDTVIQLSKLESGREFVRLTSEIEAYSCFHNLDSEDVMRFWACDRNVCLKTLAGL